MVNKLIIEDSGDPTVGIFPQRWEVDIPFDPKDKVELDAFIASISIVYGEYCDGKMTILFNGVIQ